MARAANQGGILQGENPSKYNPKDPITIFIIQAGIIIVFCRLLHYPLSKLRQPRVIAEVLGGILLGPSIFGRIPGFTDHIFPPPSMPTLTLAANLGLVLFLFLVGLEVDLRLLLSNWRIALSVGAAGMALPFGLGWAIAYGLYHEFKNDKGIVAIGFGTYALFIGVAMAITAFPVLCRILTELKLLHTQPGIVVLSAGVGNDVTGWILLALCVALVNAGSGIVALWVLLTAIAYILFLVFLVRPVFLWILRYTGSLHNGPTQGVVGLTILMTFTSAFFTGIIGIHPIFGAFIMGLICPHEGGFAIKLTEKIEDLVAVFFLPLYFALSGLNTNLGLLDNGITWAYVVGIICIAFFAKIIGGTLAARLNRMYWRESLTVGVLMSCKGLVELIVLNIGLQAKILSQRTFTMFVVMALVTTFATTPLTIALFPNWYQKKLAAFKRGDIDWDGNPLRTEQSSTDATGSVAKEHISEVKRLLVALRLESLPSIFTFVALLGGTKPENPVVKVHPGKEGQDGGDESATLDPSLKEKRPLEVHGLRMLELTERLSSVMKDSELGEWTDRDPVINAFHTFGQLNNVAVSGQVELVPEGTYSEVIHSAASDRKSDMVLLPWSERGSLTESVTPDMSESTPNAFSNGSYNTFITNFLNSTPCNAAILVNNGFGAASRDENKGLRRVHTNMSLYSNRSATAPPTAPLINRTHHIFFPFIGGTDDYIALRFVLRLAKNPNVTATIVHMKTTDGSTGTNTQPHNTATESKNLNLTTTTRDLGSTPDDDSFFASLADSLPSDLQSRVLFSTSEASTSHTIISDSVEKAKGEVERHARKNAGDLVVVGRSHGGAMGGFVGGVGVGIGGAGEGSIQTCLGSLADAMIGGTVKASVLVVQAGMRTE